MLLARVDWEVMKRSDLIPDELSWAAYPVRRHASYQMRPLSCQLKFYGLQRFLQKAEFHEPMPSQRVGKRKAGQAATHHLQLKHTTNHLWCDEDSAKEVRRKHFDRIVAISDPQVFLFG